MALAVLTHLVASTLSAMLLCLMAGRMNSIIALASLGIGAVACILLWRLCGREYRLLPRAGFLPGLLYAFILFAGLQHFLYLLYHDRHGLKTLHLNNFGDLSLHIQYIRHIAGGAHFWPDNPEFAGTSLKYPFGMDLYNALWESLGVPTDSHLFVTGLLMTAAAISMLHRWMGWWGVGAFFLNGGLANWRCLWLGRLHDFQNALAWKNFFLSLWITQRGFLFAIPAGVYVMKMVTETLLGERSLGRHEKILCILLWSGLAWFHLHTFFIISLTLGAALLLYRKWRLLIEIIVPVAVVALPFVLFSTEGLAKASVIRIQWGWVAGKEGILAFWLINVGPWLLLAPLSIIAALRNFRPLLPMIGLLSVLFLVFTSVMVAPWDWDNIKVLLWLYLLIAWVVWRTCVVRLPSRAALVLAIIVFLPGVISIVSSLPGNSKGVELYRVAELWESKVAVIGLPKDAVLATAPVPNHPALAWGAKAALGYTGHLWSHGIDFSERERKLDRMLKGSDDWLSLAHSLGVTHLYWGENERRKYGAYDPSWRRELNNVSRSPKIEVYDLRSYQAPL